MSSNWNVYKSGAQVGQCSISTEGLYYRFLCKCILRRDEISRLILKIGDFEKNLGVFVPSAGCFIVEKRIPMRDIPKGSPVFLIESESAAKCKKFVPLKPEEPFSYIARLQDAYLAHQDGQTGIVIKSI